MHPPGMHSPGSYENCVHSQMHSHFSRLHIVVSVDGYRLIDGYRRNRRLLNIIGIGFTLSQGVSLQLHEHNVNV